MLVVALKNPNAPEVELCHLYWAPAERPTALKPWRYPFTDLARRFGLRQKVLREIVEANSYTYDPVRVCPTCTRPLVYHNRSDYQQHAFGAPSQCRVCVEPSVRAFQAEQRRELEAALADNPGDATLLRNLQSHEGRYAAADAMRVRRFHPPPLAGAGVTQIHMDALGCANVVAGPKLIDQTGRDSVPAWPLGQQCHITSEDRMPRTGAEHGRKQRAPATGDGNVRAQRRETFTDCCGAKREFYFHVDNHGDKYFVLALELGGGSNGYSFAAEHPTDLQVALRDVRERVRRGIMVRYLIPHEDGPVVAHDHLVGTIESNGITIDGRFFSPEAFWTLLQPSAGSQFSLRVARLSDPPL